MATQIITGVRTIPTGGVPVWATPDPRTQPTTRAEPGLQVQVLEQTNGWAKIAFHNGWVGWADARAFTAPKPALTPLPAIGVALITVGGLLPWLSANGDSLSAWDVPLPSLLDHTSTSEDPKTGLVLLVVVLACIPYLTRNAFPPVVNLGLACIAAGAALGTFLFLNDLPGVDAGVGLMMTAAGAFALGAEAFVAKRARR